MEDDFKPIKASWPQLVIILRSFLKVCLVKIMRINLLGRDEDSEDKDIEIKDVSPTTFQSK